MSRPTSKYLQNATVTCSYSSEFRGLVYKINPYDISCMYKRMFEMCATNSLREFDDHEEGDEEENDTDKNKTIGEGTVLNIKTNHEYRGWTVCDYSHSSLIMGTARDPTAKACHLGHFLPGKTRSQSAFAKLENYVLREDRARIQSSTFSNNCRKTSSTETVSFRQTESPRNLTHGLINIQFDFKHDQPQMDQYRDQYTYRRMQLLRSNLRAYPTTTTPLPITACPKPVKIPLSRTSVYSSPVLGCLDVFGNVKDVSTYPCSVTHGHKKLSKQKLMQKTQLLQQRQSFLDTKLQTPKMDMSINLQRFLNTEECKTQSTGTSHKSDCCDMETPSQKTSPECRSRPSTSQRASIEPHTYVVTYQKK